MSTLVNRNVTLRNRRTSLRLEPAMWRALEEICRREGCTIHELSTIVDSTRRQSTLTAAVRVFALDYFREATTEAGHARAGHGRVGVSMERRFRAAKKSARPRGNGHAPANLAGG
jgi:predicted DNA-binding ribbon-helix-helix protein